MLVQRAELYRSGTSRRNKTKVFGMEMGVIRFVLGLKAFTLHTAHSFAFCLCRSMSHPGNSGLGRVSRGGLMLVL